MSETEAGRPLLDSNVLIHGVRRGLTWQKIKSECDPLMRLPKPVVCIVSHGELRSFAERNDWGDEKRDYASWLLNYFDVFDINKPAVIDAYALLDTVSHQAGITMGKNDLWIAATAHVYGATIVTTDKDFDHLDGKFLSRIYISTATNLQD
jgi:predicted nucleic acid-binding protein